MGVENPFQLDVQLIKKTNLVLGVGQIEVSQKTYPSRLAAFDALVAAIRERKDEIGGFVTIISEPKNKEDRPIIYGGKPMMDLLGLACEHYVFIDGKEFKKPFRNTYVEEPIQFVRDELRRIVS